MVAIIKAAVKLGWLMGTYSFILIHLTGLIPIVVLSLPDVAASSVILHCLGAAVGTLSWLFGSGVVKAFMFIWLLLPFVKVGLYVNYKFTHV